MTGAAAGLLTDWTGPDAIAASEMLATADRYPREGTSRSNGAAHLAWIKLSVFYTCNPRYEPEPPGCRHIPARG